MIRSVQRQDLLIIAMQIYVNMNANPGSMLKTETRGRLADEPPTIFLSANFN